MMRWIWVALFYLLSTANLAADERRDGIESTILGQVEAFLNNDLERAFEFASPNIRGIFGDPDAFGQMVQNGFPMVWRPGDVRLLELREEGGRILQRVLVVDRQGASFLFDYEMQQGPNGWQINGVFPVREPGLSA